MWECESEESLHKIFIAHSKKVIHVFLHKHEEELSHLSSLEEIIISRNLESHEVIAIRMLQLCVSNLNEKEDITFSLNIFRFISVTQDD